jgi:predicted dehydrogenase
LEIVACADLDIDRAKARAEEYSIPKYCTADELLADSDVEIVVNLTIPSAHAEVHLRALENGKHTYGEKPLAIEHGPEKFHPNPDFLYQKGAGPMFDMGPYYLTALVNLIGPVRRMSGSTSTTFKERMVTGEHNYGRKFPVETPTHISGTLDFANGAVGTITISFDVWGTRTPFHIEIHGTTGSLIVPDPNHFGGSVYIKRQGYSDFQEVPLTHGFTTNSRGIGLMDMAYAIASGTEHRASGELALHVLELMHGFHISSDEGRHYQVKSTCNKPEPLPMDIPKNGFVKNG